MNILQINKFFHVCDGTSRYFFNVSDLLLKHEHKVLYFSMHHALNKTYNLSKYFISNVSYRENIFINTFKIFSRMFYSFEARNQIKRLLDTVNIDVAHIHSIYHHISPSILLELKKRRIPIVMTVHDYHLIASNYLLFHNNQICEITKPSRYYKAIIHKCVKNSYIASFAEVMEKYLFNWDKTLVDFFIVPSEFVKKKILEYHFPREKIVVLPHFIDSSRYRPNYKNQEYILYFGRLYSEKGLDTLLKVIRSLSSISFKIVGQGPEEKKIKDFIGEYRIGNIELLGYQDENRLISLISNSLFTILPSKWYEGFGLTILESYTCGKPIVASRIGGIPEVVEDGITGLLFEPGNLEDCISKIQKLWNNPGLVKEMGRNARSYAQTKFSPEAHYRGLMRIYQKAIKACYNKPV